MLARCIPHSRLASLILPLASLASLILELAMLASMSLAIGLARQTGLRAHSRGVLILRHFILKEG